MLLLSDLRGCPSKCPKTKTLKAEVVSSVNDTIGLLRCIYPLEQVISHPYTFIHFLHPVLAHSFIPLLSTEKIEFSHCCHRQQRHDSIDDTEQKTQLSDLVKQGRNQRVQVGVRCAQCRHGINLQACVSSRVPTRSICTK